jgi:hypothetical protein
MMTEYMDVYQFGVEKLIPRYGKCLSRGGEYMEISGSAVNLNLTYFIGGQNNEIKTHAF